MDRPPSSQSYYCNLTNDALIAEASAGPDAFRAEVWLDLQAEIRKRGLKTRARRQQRRAAASRVMRSRRGEMTLGYSIAAPLAVCAMVVTVVFLARNPPFLGRLTFVAPIAVGAIVLFGAGLPIDLWNERRKDRGVSRPQHQSLRQG